MYILDYNKEIKRPGLILIKKLEISLNQYKKFKHLMSGCILDITSLGGCEDNPYIGCSSSYIVHNSYENILGIFNETKQITPEMLGDMDNFTFDKDLQCAILLGDDTNIRNKIKELEDETLTSEDVIINIDSDTNQGLLDTDRILRHNIPNMDEIDRILDNETNLDSDDEEIIEFSNRN